MLISGPSIPPDRPEQLLDEKLLARLRRLDLRSRRIFLGKLQGERRSKRRGRSVEFDDHREYVPGDDPRFIDWSVYARMERLFIKLYLEEEDLALHVALDASASMHGGDPSKILTAARLAAALAAVSLGRQNRVGLTVFGAPHGGVAHLPDARGIRHLRRFVSFLAAETWPSDREEGEPRPTASFTDGLRAIARARVGSGVLVILSDFLIDEGYEPGLRLLSAAGGYDIYCLQILAPDEIEPERAVARGMGGDLRLTDVETGRTSEVTINAALLRAYKQRLEAHCDGLHQFAAAREMMHLMIRSDANLEDVLLGRLRKAGAVG